MTPSDPTPPQGRADNLRAFSIMSFATALLFFMLGWADGVRHDKSYLHIPQTGSFLVATAAMVVLGVLFLLWAGGSRRS